MAIGEYSLLTSDYERAKYYLRRSTWIFNFLQFHRDKLSKLGFGHDLDIRHWSFLFGYVDIFTGYDALVQ